MFRGEQEVSPPSPGMSSYGWKAAPRVEGGTTTALSLRPELARSVQVFAPPRSTSPTAAPRRRLASPAAAPRRRN